MGRRSNRRFGSIALAVAALVASLADGAALRDRARLREGPSKETRLLGWVEEGTGVTIEGERNGWYSVRTTEGQTGFIWQEHLRFDSEEVATGASTATTSIGTVTTTVTTPSPDLAAGPEARPGSADRYSEGRSAAGTDTAVARELERLRAEISRLTVAQQEMSQQVVARMARPATGPAPLGTEGSAGAAVLFFGSGALLGWLVGRFVAGRRERRSRLRM